MRAYFLLLLFCGLLNPSFGQRAISDSSIIRVKRELRNVKEEILDEKEQRQAQYSKIGADSDRQFQHLGYQIDYATYGLGIFTIILTIISIALGVHVNKVWDKVEKASQAAIIANAKTEEIYNLIKNNTREIYAQIKREETLDIIDRLQVVPEDIGNFEPTLLSRNLNASDFQSIVAAFNKLRNAPAHVDRDRHLRRTYCLILSQHFPRQVILDSGTRDEALKFCNYIFYCCYELDIKKIIPEFVRALGMLNMLLVHKHAELIFRGIAVSEHRTNPAIYDLLTTSIGDPDTWVAFYLMTGEDSLPEKLARLEFLHSFKRVHMTDWPVVGRFDLEKEMRRFVELNKEINQDDLDEQVSEMIYSN